MKRGEPLERKTPLARGKGLKRAGRVKPKRDTPRRGRLVLTGDDRKALRLDVWNRASRRCEAGIDPNCPGTLAEDAFEWHHRKLRSQGGNDEHVNSLCLCHDCHVWVHANPSFAKRYGLIVASMGDPESRAVTLWDGRVVSLTAEGGYDLVFGSDTPTMGEAS